ncbi:PKD domain-containing protein [Aquimarina sp. AU119]|uniref:PKD domain-containing protein n=1 Tax=Aquimarina sp. AU119 TaxID=2108528 RepID=UPI00135CDAD7|nr:PKD domain-containing protein [Aquimarina sp. AU119]
MKYIKNLIPFFVLFGFWSLKAQISTSYTNATGTLCNGTITVSSEVSFAGPFSINVTSSTSSYNQDQNGIDHENPAFFSNLCTGEYEVTVLNKFSCENFSETISISDQGGSGNDGLAADFTVNTTDGRAPLTVYFSDQSSGDIDGWYWEFPFGEPNYSYDQNPSVAYTTSGDKDVSLTVYDTKGNSHTITKNDYINVEAQLPPLTLSLKACSDPYASTCGSNFSDTALIHFIPEVSLSIGNVQYNWDFGDGHSIEGSFREVYSYSNTGSYTVTLSITNDYGQSASASVIINIRDINEQSITPNFDSNGDQNTVEVGYNSPGVSYSDATIYQNIDPSEVDYFWDFGTNALNRYAYTRGPHSVCYRKNSGTGVDLQHVSLRVTPKSQLIGPKKIAKTNHVFVKQSNTRFCEAPCEVQFSDISLTTDFFNQEPKLKFSMNSNASTCSNISWTIKVNGKMVYQRYLFDVENNGYEVCSYNSGELDCEDIEYINRSSIPEMEVNLAWLDEIPAFPYTMKVEATVYDRNHVGETKKTIFQNFTIKGSKYSDYSSADKIIRHEFDNVEVYDNYATKENKILFSIAEQYRDRENTNNYHLYSFTDNQFQKDVDLDLFTTNSNMGKFKFIDNNSILKLIPYKRPQAPPGIKYHGITAQTVGKNPKKDWENILDYRAANPVYFIKSSTISAPTIEEIPEGYLRYYKWDSDGETLAFISFNTLYIKNLQKLSNNQLESNGATYINGSYINQELDIQDDNVYSDRDKVIVEGNTIAILRKSGLHIFKKEGNTWVKKKVLFTDLVNSPDYRFFSDFDMEGDKVVLGLVRYPIKSSVLVTDISGDIPVYIHDLKKEDSFDYIQWLPKQIDIQGDNVLYFSEMANLGDNYRYQNFHFYQDIHKNNNFEINETERFDFTYKGSLFLEDFLIFLKNDIAYIFDRRDPACKTDATYNAYGFTINSGNSIYRNVKTSQMSSHTQPYTVESSGNLYVKSSETVLQFGFTARPGSKIDIIASDCGYYNEPISGIARLTEIPEESNEQEVFPTIENHITIYPNPAKDRLSIESSSKMQLIELYSITGRRIYYKSGLNTSSHTIQTLDYPDGMYFAKIHTSRGHINKKLLIKK